MASICQTVFCALLCAAAPSSPVVANPSLLAELGRDEIAVLDAQYLVARTTREISMFDIYEQASRRGRPVVVTSDPLFHALCLLYQRTLLATELEHLYPTLETVLRRGLRHQTALLRRTEHPEVRRALLANIAFLSVPLALLSDGFAIPLIVRPRVESELGLIYACAGPDSSHILGAAEDFSRYRPRGRYATSDRLARYFRAVTYFSRMAVPIASSDNVDRDVRLARRAILLAEAVESHDESGSYLPGLRRSVHEPLAYLVGEEPAFLPSDCARLSLKLRGRRDLVAWLAQDSAVLGFIAHALSTDSAASSAGATRPWYENPAPRPSAPVSVPAPVVLRLLNPRSLADPNRYLDILSLPEEADSIRPAVPTVLRTMVALGSDRARQLLIPSHREATDSFLPARLDSAAMHLALTPGSQWNADVPSAWLYALKLQLEPVTLPRRRNLVADFALSDAYEDKCLLTACAALTELRLALGQGQPTSSSDAALRQPAARIQEPEIPARPPAFARPVAYVEPKPHVFDQLAGIAEEMRRRLKRAGFVEPALEAKLDRFSSICRTLAAIARQQIHGVEPNYAETELCLGLGGTLAELTAPAHGETAPPSLRRVVEPTGIPGLLLHQTLGEPCLLYAIVPTYDNRYLALGATYSWHEFVLPADRATEPEEPLFPGRAPGLPAWTRTFILR